MASDDYKELVNTFLGIYEQGYEAGYEAAAKKYNKENKELLALARITKEDLAWIVEASIKPEYKVRLSEPPGSVSSLGSLDPEEL